MTAHFILDTQYIQKSLYNIHNLVSYAFCIFLYESGLTCSFRTSPLLLFSHPDPWPFLVVLGRMLRIAATVAIALTAKDNVCPPRACKRLLPSPAGPAVMLRYSEWSLGNTALSSIKIYGRRRAGGIKYLLHFSLLSFALGKILTASKYIHRRWQKAGGYS